MKEPEARRKEAVVGAPRRRGAELEQAILGAAWDVLVEDGYRAFTYEAVAARAGTSRPVLYRRWPGRSDLLVATLSESRRANPIKVPDTGALREDAVQFLANANQARARATALVGLQLLEFFRDTGGSFRALRGALGSGPSAFEIFVARAVKRGELRALGRSSRVINLPLDMFRYELFTTLRPVPAEVVSEIVDDIWLPLLG
jgi:AcrR family transcriptional regulator